MATTVNVFVHINNACILFTAWLTRRYRFKCQSILPSLEDKNIITFKSWLPLPLGYYEEHLKNDNVKRKILHDRYKQFTLLLNLLTYLYLTSILLNLILFIISVYFLFLTQLTKFSVLNLFFFYYIYLASFILYGLDCPFSISLRQTRVFFLAFHSHTHTHRICWSVESDSVFINLEMSSSFPIVEASLQPSAGYEKALDKVNGS